MERERVVVGEDPFHLLVGGRRERRREIEGESPLWAHHLEGFSKSIEFKLETLLYLPKEIIIKL